MKVLWTAAAWDDYLAWQRDDPAVAARINLLIAEIRRTPFVGLGKPEPLRGTLSGWWSRRITGEHRLVYRVAGKDANQHVEIVQTRLHY